MIEGVIIKRQIFGKSTVKINPILQGGLTDIQHVG